MGKKKVLPILTAAVVIVIAVAGIQAGRKANDKGGGVPNASEWFLTYLNDSYSPLGRLYAEEGYLHFLDASTGEEHIICNDAACAHRREDCSAYFPLTAEGIVEEDGLLLLTNYGADRANELYLYETALNGGQRRQIAKLSDNIQFIMGAAVTDEYIAINYINSQDENGEMLDECKAGILLYDRRNNSSRDIVQITMWNASTMYPTIIGNRLYYEYMGYEMSGEEALAHAEDEDYYEERLQLKLAVCNIDGEDGSTEDIAEIDDFNPLTIYDNCILYTAGDRLYSYNVETGKAEILGKAMRVLPGDGRGGIYLVDYSSQDRHSVLYRYDGEIRRVGEHTDEWVLAVVFENVVYARYYDGKINSGDMKAVPPETFID